MITLPPGYDTIVRMKVGSHLYGTVTESSDADYKSIFVPSGDDILLQQCSNNFNSHRNKEKNEKNISSDVDEEAYSLHKFLKLCVEGQPIAVEMLFAPKEAILQSSPLWRTIVENRRMLLSKRSSSFVAYCQAQANKYSLRGNRVAAVRTVCEFFKDMEAIHTPHLKLFAIPTELEMFASLHRYTEVIDLPVKNSEGVKYVSHFSCCGKKIPCTNKISDARKLYEGMLQSYGERSRVAEENSGVDWKALSHAVRIANECIELLSTGKITLPLINADHIIDIKTGKLSYDEVSDEIEKLLHEVEDAQKNSKLQSKVDQKFIDNLKKNVYIKKILENVPGGIHYGKKY